MTIRTFSLAFILPLMILAGGLSLRPASADDLQHPADRAS